MTLIGPFTQLLTMENLSTTGPVEDEALQIIENAGIRFSEGVITGIGKFNEMQAEEIISIDEPAVALPGWIDAHTHICFAGNRASDYASRLAGISYQEIARKGGGIMETVRKTRKATDQELEQFLEERLQKLASWGVTTCEVKSGYGLTIEDEIRLLQIINKHSNLVPTCLAAHVCPPEFETNRAYLKFIEDNLFPILIKQNLSKRIDIFVDEHAFTVSEAREYLEQAKKMKFDVLIHANQFSPGGAALAAEIKALSADHLEEITSDEAHLLKKANVIPIVLPGAALGIGISMPPARMLLDQGLSLVIASDWNPGSAPMGNLIAQASILAMQQKITTAETFAALTQRAAKALKLQDRGILSTSKRADFNIYFTKDYRDILYYQGSLTPSRVYSQGNCIFEL